MESKKLKEKIFKSLCLGSVFISVFLFVFIFLYILFNSLGFLSKNFIEFFSDTFWRSFGQNKHWGILPSILGTLYLAIGAILLSFPVSLGCAICSAESKNKIFKSITNYLISVMSGIPSVVYGLIGLTLFVPLCQKLGSLSGYSVLAGILVLALMIFPTMTSIFKISLESTPEELKASSFGLGGSKIQTLKYIIIPYAKKGLIAGVLFAVSRAIGETMAVTMVIGNNNNLIKISGQNLFGLLEPARTLTSTIMLEVQNASDSEHLGAIFACGLVLIFFTICINSLAIFIINQDKKFHENFNK